MCILDELIEPEPFSFPLGSREGSGTRMEIDITNKRKVFLNGSSSLTAKNNTKLFLEVQKFIIESKGFTNE